MKKNILIGFLLLLTSACTMPAATPQVESTSTQTPLPPPTTVSVTPSLVPTETTVPTPEPPPLYFTDEFVSSDPYWQFTQAAGSSAPVIDFNGSLQIDFKSPDTWMIGIHTAHTYENVLVAAKADISPDGSIGLICRYSEDGWYEFNISNGVYSLLFGSWLAPGVAKYVPIIIEENSAVSNSGEFSLFCEDTFLRAYAGEKLLRNIDVTNYGLTEGNAGVAAASFVDTLASAAFEWFTVSEK